MTNAASSKMSVEDMIRHYQRSIERSEHDPKRVKLISNGSFYYKYVFEMVYIMYG